MEITIPLIVIVLFGVLILFSVYALATEHGRSIAFPSNKDVNPFIRFILPFLIGVIIIAVEAVSLIPQGLEGRFWVRVAVFLALLNGIGWGFLNIIRTKIFSVWIGMAVLSIFISGILIIPSLSMIILVFAMIALKTLRIWPLFALLFLILVILNKAGMLAGILGVLFQKPKEKVEVFLSKNKKRIYSLSAIILIAPFVIITLFYLMMYLGWGPNIGPMGH